MKNLNQRQKKFVKEYIKTGNATQSAIYAGYSESTAPEQGSRLLRNVKVKEALEDKQIKLEEKFEYTMEQHFNELEDLRQEAIRKNQLSVANKSIELKGRLFGFYTERTEKTETKETFEERLKKFRNNKKD